MPIPSLTDDQLREVIAVWRAHDCNAVKAAAALGVNYETFKSRIKNAKARGLHLSDGARRVVSRAQISGAEAKGGWIHDYDSDGKKIGTTRWTAEDVHCTETVAENLRAALSEIHPGDYTSVAPLTPSTTGTLLVLDLADVHVGKLSVETETGYSYSREAATERMLHGTTALLKKARGHNVARILFVLGNDILHVDGAKKQTTSGTPQDTHGSVHEMYRDAQAAYIAAIEYCAAHHVVDLMYCPSNHDWLMGWALAGSIGAWFRNHPNVQSTEYALSERHRKYYRFEQNLIGLTHGDGARESDLYPLMMTEARSHVSSAKFCYWYLHHYHHKIRKAQGVRPHDREKDHIGLTIVKSGVTAQAGDNVLVEYVRSPSPPDSWHDRKGYVNRQAVECFVHDPFEGQTARFTHWF